MQPFDYGGQLVPVSESVAVTSGAIPVKVGIFVENLHDFDVATQSIAAEVVSWISWLQAFQKIMDEEGLTIDQVISPINRVNWWDSVTQIRIRLDHATHSPTDGRDFVPQFDDTGVLIAYDAGYWGRICAIRMDSLRRGGSRQAVPHVDPTDRR